MSAITQLQAEIRERVEPRCPWCQQGLRSVPVHPFFFDLTPRDLGFSQRDHWHDPPRKGAKA